MKIVAVSESIQFSLEDEQTRLKFTITVKNGALYDIHPFMKDINMPMTDYLPLMARLNSEVNRIMAFLEKRAKSSQSVSIDAVNGAVYDHSNDPRPVA